MGMHIAAKFDLLVLPDDLMKQGNTNVPVPDKQHKTVVYRTRNDQETRTSQNVWLPGATVMLPLGQHECKHDDGAGQQWVQLL